jgi:hypothetical protein
MISIGVNSAEVQALARVLDNNAKNLRKQMYIVVNKTAAKTKSMIAKEVAKQLVVPQKIVKKSISLKKAKQIASIDRTSAIVTQRALNGFPVKMLKPNANYVGVTYKGKGKKAVTIRDAFMGPTPERSLVKFRGHAFARVGKQRLPIKKQFGPSAIEIFIELGTEARAVKFAREQLKKEIIERTRFLGLKKSGAI